MVRGTGAYIRGIIGYCKDVEFSYKYKGKTL